jgi:hypothetical protein
MNLLLAALLATSAQSTAADIPPPPREMIDFLGRRRLCLELPAEAERSAFAQAESRRLACASLASEERRWRDRYRADADALAWLDRDPRDFQLPGVVVVQAWDGPPGAYVHRMEWNGTEEGGPRPFHLSIDGDAENGAATMIIASYGDVPARSFRIDNARFPWLDLQSVRVAMGSGASRDALSVTIRFGFRRGYCAFQDRDDRPRLAIAFGRDRISASYEDRTNCGTGSVSLTGPG